MDGGSSKRDSPGDGTWEAASLLIRISPTLSASACGTRQSDEGFFLKEGADTGEAQHPEFTASAAEPIRLSFLILSRRATLRGRGRVLWICGAARNALQRPAAIRPRLLLVITVVLLGASLSLPPVAGGQTFVYPHECLWIVDNGQVASRLRRPQSFQRCAGGAGRPLAVYDAGGTRAGYRDW